MLSTGPASSPTLAKLLHLEQLRLNVDLRKKEVAELREMKAKLEGDRSKANLSFLGQLLRDKEALQRVTLAQASDVLALVRNAIAEENDEAKAIRKLNTELRLHIRRRESEATRHVETLAQIQHKTGYTKDSKAAHVAAPLRSLEELNVILTSQKQAIAGLKLLVDRQQKAIPKLADEIARRRELHERAMVTMNDILVKERSVNEAKEALRQLLLEHSNLDVALKIATERQDQTTVPLLQVDIDSCKRASNDIVERRRAEDRILKAQEARCEVLNRRIAMVQNILSDSGLSQLVEQRVAELFRTRDATKGDATKELLEKYASIEHLVPEVEELPNAIMALFVNHLELRRHKLRLLESLRAEKQATCAASQTKLSSLQHEFDQLSDELHEVKIRSDARVEERAADAKEMLNRFKLEYEQLLLEGAELSAKLARQRSQRDRSEYSGVASSSLNPQEPH